ncbi:hypothetical protein OSTOST_07367 [Ostertagia ostertagi]
MRAHLTDVVAEKTVLLEKCRKECTDLKISHQDNQLLPAALPYLVPMENLAHLLIQETVKCRCSKCPIDLQRGQLKFVPCYPTPPEEPDSPFSSWLPKDRKKDCSPPVSFFNPISARSDKRMHPFAARRNLCPIKDLSSLTRFY